MGTATVIHGNARHLPLANDSVDLICTSPPYFALRSYTDAGVHYEGQIGSEPTPAEFVDALLKVTAECMRVLKPSGSLWVNLGDKYDSGTTTARINPGTIKDGTGQGYHLGSPRVSLGRPKSLIGIPWRYALRCIDDLGLILRAEVIWSKPNGLPESVTDRVRRSHEQWFHMTLNPRYYSAVDEIREASSYVGPTWDQRKAAGQPMRHGDTGGGASQGAAGGMAVNPLGKLPGSVWTIPTEPLTVPDHLGVDHFAAFPTEWPKRIIAGWSPAGVCCACGEGRRPVADVVLQGGTPFAGRDYRRLANGPSGGPERPMPGGRNEVTITGYACACPEPTADTTPGVVLDPFGGTGTTAMVAKALGRHGITVDMSSDYSRLARWRTTDRNQLAKVLGIEKVAAPDPGQLDLFGEATA